MNPWGKIDRHIRLRRALCRSIPYVVLSAASLAVLVLVGRAYFATK
jgi:hypothetical protein